MRLFKTKYSLILSFFIFSLLLLISFNNSNEYMVSNNIKISSDTGFQSPNIAENIDNEGSPDFYLPYYAKIQDDIYTVCEISPYGISDWIRVSKFGFSSPEGSIINGIEVQIDDYGVLLKAWDIYLVLDNSIIGDDREDGTTIKISDTDIYRSYGGGTDMWETSLIDSDIEKDTFGVQIYYKNDGFMGSGVYVDHIQIKVYYTITENGVITNWEGIIIFLVIMMGIIFTIGFMIFLYYMTK